MYQTCEKVTLKKNEFRVVENVLPNIGANKYCFDVEGDGNGIVMSFKNEGIGDAKITLFASENVFCGGDKVIVVPSYSSSVVYLELAPYVQMNGEYKGKILLENIENELSFSVAEIL